MSQAVSEAPILQPKRASHLLIIRGLKMSDEQFFDLCQTNQHLCLERTRQGEIVIMPPTGWKTSERNAEITMQLRQWAKQEGSGTTADSSGGFRLPNGATRSPDAAWVRYERLTQLTEEQLEAFISLSPDFALELRSPSDDLAYLQAKMEEYIANGVGLGWLIDPQEQRVYVYRPNTPVEVLENPESVSGEPELPGFVLQLEEIWQPNL